MFIKYSTCQIPPKKSRGKGSQGKKTTYTSVTDVDVFEESKPELVRKRTTSKRRVKKKLMIFAEDNWYVSDILKRTKIRPKLDKTKHENGKSVKNQS
ncbi:hypothetical protein Tco_0018266 [Tanacetum coccineum]